jgi:hypothetical protein
MRGISDEIDQLSGSHAEPLADDLSHLEKQF